MQKEENLLIFLFLFLRTEVEYIKSIAIKLFVKALVN